MKELENQAAVIITTGINLARTLHKLVLINRKTDYTKTPLVSQPSSKQSIFKCNCQHLSRLLFS